MEKIPGFGGKQTGSHEHKNYENFLAQGIDNNLASEVFQRNEQAPNSLVSYWNKILENEGLPTEKEEYIHHTLETMDRVLLPEFKETTRSSDKMYVEKNIRVDSENAEKDPKRYAEKLLEQVYGECFVKVLKNKEVMSGGNNEEISLLKSTMVHPYDVKKRQVQQVLSMEDTRSPNKKYNLGLGVQWGHENTDQEAIENRINFIISGIMDFGATTELWYTTVDEKQTMPISVPFVVVGGDIRRMTSLVDLTMKKEYGEAIKSSLLYNGLIQIKTQIDLYCKIAQQQQEEYSKAKMPTDAYRQMKFVYVKDKLHETVNSYLEIKNIIDQVFEANEPSIKERARPDAIHQKIMGALSEIAKRNNIE